MFTTERFAMNGSEKSTVLLWGCAWKRNSVAVLHWRDILQTAEGALHTEIFGP